MKSLSVVKTQERQREIIMQPKTKRVNIYLTNEIKGKLKQYQSKYHISLSTMASEIYFSYCCVAAKELLEKEYIIRGGTKTSIKPKDKGFTPNNKDMAYTNALVIFIEKKEMQYLGIEKHQFDILRDKIHKFLNDAKDTFWMYNETIRNQRRSLRENKDYFKKALGD